MERWLGWLEVADHLSSIVINIVEGGLLVAGAIGARWRRRRRESPVGAEATTPGVTAATRQPTR